MPPTLKGREEYRDLRRRFEPEDIKLVIVTEAPPSSGLYFYDPTGLITEPLFAAIMRELGRSPKTKEDGLREMQRRGWILFDATYEAVHGMTPAARDALIARDYPLLRDDLKGLLAGRPVPVFGQGKRLSRAEPQIGSGRLQRAQPRPSKSIFRAAAGRSIFIDGSSRSNAGAGFKTGRRSLC